MPNIVNSVVSNLIFMHDNAPCNKAKTVMSYLEQQDLEVMDWPSQSPDLNLIEFLWKPLGVKDMTRSPINTEDLLMKLKKE